MTAHVLQAIQEQEARVLLLVQNGFKGWMEQLTCEAGVTMHTIQTHNWTQTIIIIILYDIRTNDTHTHFKL